MAQEPNADPVRSEFSDDPDMRELVEVFVDEMPDRIEAIQNTWSEQDLEGLRQIAHQLKGASGGYGFSPLGDVAMELEYSIRETAEIDEIRQHVDELVDMCNRVSL